MNRRLVNGLASAILVVAACSSGDGEDAGTDDGGVENDGALLDTRRSDAEGADATAGDAAADAGNLFDAGAEAGDPDVNGDGSLDILILGTSRSIRASGGGFAGDAIAAELESILSDDSTLSLAVRVRALDIYQREGVDVGVGQGGDIREYAAQGHSLMQYYHWPQDRATRLAELGGAADVDWDQVILAADPELVARTPGYYALGVHQVSEHVHAGGAQARVLMVWPRDDAADSLSHFEEFTYRAANGAARPLPTVPAGLAWSELPAEMRDSGASHPSPNGAYLAAATIYAELLGQSASNSDYTFNDAIADSALASVESAAGRAHYSGPRTFVSPFAPCAISDRVLNYNHTGTSSENGILSGLRWVLERARVELVNGGDAPIDFNYGRANTNFEADKRYQIDPDQFEFSLGFPMQDNSNTGDTSMLYGLDYRNSENENGTDLGTALYMSRNGELPTGRAIPIRTLFARMREANPEQSAYRDAWHMDRDLDRASGAFMYTLLTGHCALGEEPADTDSAEWRSWMAHRVGYETAWTLMHLRSRAPAFRVLPESEESVSVAPGESATLAISFANAPTSDVVVRLSTDNDDAVTLSTRELVFTPANHARAQTVTLTGQDGAMAEESFVLRATTDSRDQDFHGFVDGWEYRVERP